MSTPPAATELTPEKVEAILRQWRNAPHSEEDEEALASGDFMRTLLEEIKKECPQAEAACDKAMQKFDKALVESMVEDAVAPAAHIVVPGSDTNLVDVFADEKKQ